MVGEIPKLAALAASCLLMAGVPPPAWHDDPPAPSAVLHIRAYADATLDGSVSTTVRDVAGRLLADAGVDTRWTFCDPEAECPRDADARTDIIVILRDTPAPRPGRCGLSARRDTPPGGTVWVHLPCIADAAHAVAPVFARREDPAFLTREHDDVAGAVAAHEVGHLLGLGHADKGLMRADWDAADLVALRRGQLRFRDPELARMRQHLASTEAPAPIETGALETGPGLTGPGSPND